MRRAACGAVAVVVWVAAGVLPAPACDTPVFRYAMYNWAPAPYYVFYLHHGQVAEEDQAVNNFLDGLCRADPSANLALAVVDVSKQAELQRLPRVVRKAYQSHAEGQRPLHLVFSPWVLFYGWFAEPPAAPPAGEGQKASEPSPVVAELFAGRLDEAKAKAIVDSPARQQLGKLLRDGNAIVLLILTGPDEQANKRAAEAAGEVVAMAARGEFPISTGDGYLIDDFLPKPPDDPAAEDGRRRDSPTLKLAVLKLSRTDPAEKWLVDCLLSVEPDLRDAQFAKSPMVFPVFGRGRAMLPLVGKGITRENLAECVTFLTGPCSCVVKDQNPGADLLVRYDWDAVAEALAAEDGTGGGPWGYQEFIPNESGNQTEASVAEVTWTATASAALPSVGQSRAPPNGRGPNTGQPVDGQRTNSPPKPAQNQLAKRVPAESPSIEGRAAVEGKAQLGGAPDSFAVRQALKIGAWLALGAAVVLIAGFVLVYRQRPN
jgi:hypothetical protein